MVSDATGLSIPTVRSVRDDENSNPTYKVLVALANYLAAPQAEQANG
jgi:hypothetical protein